MPQKSMVRTQNHFELRDTCELKRKHVRTKSNGTSSNPILARVWGQLARAYFTDDLIEKLSPS